VVLEMGKMWVMEHIYVCVLMIMPLLMTLPSEIMSNVQGKPL